MACLGRGEKDSNNCRLETAARYDFFFCGGGGQQVQVQAHWPTRLHQASFGLNAGLNKILYLVEGTLALFLISTLNKSHLNTNPVKQVHKVDT